MLVKVAHDSERGTRQDLNPNLEEYLSVPESPKSDYMFFRDRWTPGTCGWVLHHHVFTEWFEDHHKNPRVLWIHGNPGSGKSILSSFVIDHTVQQGLPCHYFYIRSEDKEKRALSMILRSLACQIASSIPAFADKLRILQAAATDINTADYLNIWQWLYKQSLFQLDIGHPIYWIIDGVDEADSPESLIRLLGELDMTSIPIRVLVVSRKTHGISATFRRLKDRVLLDTLAIEGNREDFLFHIKREMDIAGDDSYQELVTSQILERARGNFLWVHLAVQRINQCYTKVEVDDALDDLPEGMEALYDRMANAVQTSSNYKNRRLGEDILGWVTCAKRPLRVEEFSDALECDDILDMHRIIGDLCGGFVVIDKENKVTLIHETAREYLTRGTDPGLFPVVNCKPTNDKLFKRCIMRLSDRTLRSQINPIKPPPLLDYAANSWFFHLSQGSFTQPDITDTLLNFLRGQYVLTWITMAAKRNQLKTLVVASRYLSDVALKLQELDQEEKLANGQAIDTIAGWATDLVKVVGQFGSALRSHSTSVYKLIPPLCPKDSIIYQQFGSKESKTLHVSGLTTRAWDDCLARLPLDQDTEPLTIRAAGTHIAIHTNRKIQGLVFVFNCNTFEKLRTIFHAERILRIEIDSIGDNLLIYGWKTTKVWSLATGDCVKAIRNPRSLPRPQTLLFIEEENKILVGGEDSVVRSLSLKNNSTEWEIEARIQERSLLETVPINSPICSALSPDRKMIAFGYRRHPVTVWGLDPPVFLSHCNMRIDGTVGGIQDYNIQEAVTLKWHPFTGEIFGLAREGTVFKWDPDDEEPCASVRASGHFITISQDGSLIATGDSGGVVNVYATSDLRLLYRLSSPDPVSHLSFSTDSRRLYDLRSTYGSVREPSALIRLADSTEYNQNSDPWSEIKSHVRLFPDTEYHYAGAGNVVSLAGQSTGPLYCYGGRFGIAFLCEVGFGKVCELEGSVCKQDITKVTWSDDGRRLAIADLFGRLSIKSISAKGQGQGAWQVQHEFHVEVPTRHWPFHQLLFYPSGRRLLACMKTAFHSVDMHSHDIIESVFPTGMPKVKWICHPTMPNYLLGFGSTTVHVFTWAELREVKVYTYCPTPFEPIATDISTKPGLRTPSAPVEAIRRLVSRDGSPDILLEISRADASGRPESKYLIFAAADIGIEATEGTNSVNELRYTLLPAGVGSRIREPLAFLSHRRLIFLDVDRWICAWSLSSSGPRRPSANSGVISGDDGIEMYYCLPGDWAASDEMHLCSLMSGETFLCPRNGEVAAVRFAKLRN